LDCITDGSKKRSRRSRVTRRAQRLKWPDRWAERWEEAALGEDEHGVWSCLPPLAPMTVSNGDIVRCRYPLLICYPKDRWWVAMFQPGSERIVETHHPDGAMDLVTAAEHIYVHMASPPTFTAEGVSFIDLMLDVIRLPDGTITVLDEDELDLAAAQRSVPSDAVANARRACDEVAAMLRADIEPFGEVWADWLNRFLERKG
jgi:uncharacterized protein